MEYGLTRREQIVCNDTAVAPPPDRLGAHDGASLLLTERAKARETGMKGFGQAVVGIIMKALILPKRIYPWRDFVLLSAQASQRGDALISDLVLRERLRKNVVIELRI